MTEGPSRRLEDGGAVHADSGRWTEVSPSRFPHEREGLHFVRDNLPTSEPYRAWSNFEFIARGGSQYEVDLLVLGPAGLHLVELKAWSGRITGNEYEWFEHNPAVQHPIRRSNPLGITSTKAKALRDWLERAAKRLGHTVQVPWVQESLFLHGPGVDARPLPENVRQLVFGRDDATGNGLRRIVVDRLGMPPRRGAPLGSQQRKALERLMEEIGLRGRPKETKVGPWLLTDEQLGSGWGWLDHRAVHTSFPDQQVRVRRWFVPEGAGASGVATVQQAAKREYAQLYGLSHPGLVAPSEYHETEGAVAALVYKDVEGSRSLGEWVASHGTSASLELKIHVVRGAAEVIRYAHGHGLAHRGLGPQSVSVLDGDTIPRVLVRDWQSAGSADAASSTMTHHARDLVEHADEQAKVYAAPEVVRGVVTDRRLADVFSIGALAYLVLTGKEPAADEPSLRERLDADSGLILSADVDSPLQALEDAVWTATSPRVHDRFGSVDELIAALDEVLDDLTAPSQDSGLVDPVEAGPSDMVADDMMVLRRLGEGATSIALLVEREDGLKAVLKAARDEDKAARLAEEAATLERVPPTGLVARLVAPPLTVLGRTCLLVEQAGEQPLASEIARLGRVNLDMLQRWGRDLLEALALLEGSGILHRDVKPANLGVRTRSSDGQPHLVLFDFSLSAAPVTDLEAGTAHYRDPFLGTGTRRIYDQAAELFAAAVTLHEMATGRTPVWGDGRTDPAMLDVEVTVDPALFDPSVAPAMADFFATALARDVTARHDNVQDMAAAWDKAFEAAAGQPPEAGPAAPDELAASATLATALEAAGLSARALSALEQYDVVTVGDLLRLPPLELSRVPGAAQGTKDELASRAKDWRRRLAAPGEADPRASIDSLVTALLALVPAQADDSARVVRFMLGQGDEHTDSQPRGWPTVHEVQAELDLDREVVEGAWGTFLDEVRGSATLQQLHQQVLADLEPLEGVASADELASRLLAAHGSHAEEPLRSAQALALVRLVAESLPGEGALAFRRRGEVVLVAGAGGEGESAHDVLEWAVALAEPAESLALQASLAAPATCLEVLRAASSADLPGEPVSDARLLSLAAAASGTAAVSSRGEVYPRAMSAARALALSRASLVSGGRPLSERTVQARVRARFPEATPLPGRPALDRLLVEAGIDLRWKGDFYQSESLPSSFTRAASSTAHGAGADASALAVDAALERSLVESGFLAIAVPQRHAVRTQHLLEQSHPVSTFDLSARVLDELREDARASGADWQFVLRADSLPPQDPTARQLAAIVRAAAVTVLGSLAEVQGPVLVVGASLLARFSCVDLLAPLADLAATRPAARWLLVPQTGATSPDLDGAAVPVAASGQWLTIPTSWSPSQQLVQPHQEAGGRRP